MYIPEKMLTIFWSFVLMDKNTKLTIMNYFKCFVKLFEIFLSKYFFIICLHYSLYITHFFMSHLTAGCIINCLYLQVVNMNKVVVNVKLRMKNLIKYVPICHCNELIFIASQICYIYTINFYDVLFYIFALIWHHNRSKSEVFILGDCCST